MGYYTCIALHCKSVSPRCTKDLRFHRIPSDYDRRVEWLKACRRPELINKSPDFFKNKHVCSKHFEITMYKKTNLHRSAAPVLNLAATFQDSCTQTTDSTHFLNPTPGINELSTEHDLKNIQVTKSHTETEEFMHCASHNLEVNEENDNTYTQIHNDEVQTAELGKIDEVERETNESLQMTDSDQESEEDICEMSIDEFLKDTHGLEGEIRKVLKKDNIPQTPINEIEPRPYVFEINKETQTDDVMVYNIPKNNVCFQQCLRCGKNASRLMPKQLKPDHEILLDDFNRACEKFLSPPFCAIVKNQIYLEQLVKRTLTRKSVYSGFASQSSPPF